MTEQLQVPPADFQSYYGRPILKVTRWKEPHLPLYLVLGEMSGAMAMVGAVAHVLGRPPLARTARLTAAGAAYCGSAVLMADLGRPERFLHMLRVAKPTSPMSVGSWILSGHSALVSVAAASELTGQLAGLGTLAGAASALTGPLLAAYPGVLFANTAVPAWHTAYRELPLLLVGGAMTSAGAAGLAASAVSGDHADFDAASRLAMIGAAVESIGRLRPGANARPVGRAVPHRRRRQDADDGAVPHDQRGTGGAGCPAQPYRGRGVGDSARRWRAVREVRRAAGREGIGSRSEVRRRQPAVPRNTARPQHSVGFVAANRLKCPTKLLKPARCCRHRWLGWPAASGVSSPGPLAGPVRR